MPRLSRLAALRNKGRGVQERCSAMGGRLPERHPAAAPGLLTWTRPRWRGRCSRWQHGQGPWLLAGGG